MEKTYKIKSEDKAAFLNKLEKLGVGIDSFDIVDNKLENCFEFTPKDPTVVDVVKTILKQSPKIDQIKERIRELVRNELRS